ncbi:MAG: hypothetical protein JNM59_12535 [Hyphomonadaceae bacterium]|nr:hypothetical protein [Hyphomonadaceae bacterium]
MARTPPRAPGRRLLLLGALALAAFAFAPFLAAGGAGRLIANLWVSTMGAVAGLIGGLFGG